MVSNSTQRASAPKHGQRRGFSDDLQRRRGHRDGETGRAPASMSPAYRTGYAEGRRRRNSKAKAKAEASTEGPVPQPMPSASGLGPV